MAARYTHYYDTFSDQVLCAPWMIAEMLRRAELGAAHAKANAPKESGNYAASITASAGIRPAEGAYKRRAVGRVAAEDPASFQIEHGTKKTPAHRTLGHTLPVMKAG